MKTDVANKGNAENVKLEPVKGKPAAADEPLAVKGLRRTLQPLQKTAGSEREGLVGGGRSSVTSKEKLTVVDKPSKRLKPAERRVTADDLTSDEPSAAYWEALAERRRVALEAALEENQRLTERITFLEEENAQANATLIEAREVIANLTELLNESESFETSVEPLDTSAEPINTSSEPIKDEE